MALPPVGGAQQTDRAAVLEGLFDTVPQETAFGGPPPPLAAAFDPDEDGDALDTFIAGLKAQLAAAEEHEHQATEEMRTQANEAIQRIRSDLGARIAEAEDRVAATRKELETSQRQGRTGAAAQAQLERIAALYPNAAGTATLRVSRQQQLGGSQSALQRPEGFDKVWTDLTTRAREQRATGASALAGLDILGAETTRGAASELGRFILELQEAVTFLSRENATLTQKARKYNQRIQQAIGV
jgi:hypothetical protein